MAETQSNGGAKIWRRGKQSFPPVWKGNCVYAPEHWDGYGYPEGLHGESILRSSAGLW